jgi:hypothetical protein
VLDIKNIIDLVNGIRHDTLSGGVFQAEGVADGDYLVSFRYLFINCQVDGGYQGRLRGLQKGQVVFGIGIDHADELLAEDIAVDHDFFIAADDLFVGDNEFSLPEVISRAGAVRCGDLDNNAAI